MNPIYKDSLSVADRAILNLWNHQESALQRRRPLLEAMQSAPQYAHMLAGLQLSATVIGCQGDYDWHWSQDGDELSLAIVLGAPLPSVMRLNYGLIADALFAELGICRWSLQDPQYLVTFHYCWELGQWQSECMEVA